MFLSQEEVKELTGYKVCKKQVKWLRENGFKHAVDICGRPKVLVSHVESELGSSEKNQRKRSEPDFSMFDNRKLA